MPCLRRQPHRRLLALYVVCDVYVDACTVAYQSSAGLPRHSLDSVFHPEARVIRFVGKRAQEHPRAEPTRRLSTGGIHPRQHRTAAIWARLAHGPLQRLMLSSSAFFCVPIFFSSSSSPLNIYPCFARAIRHLKAFAPLHCLLQ